VSTSTLKTLKKSGKFTFSPQSLAKINVNKKGYSMKLSKRCFLSLIGLSMLSFAAHADDQTPPQGPPHDGHPHPKLTAEQKACMDSKLGKPDEGERPTREAVHAALKACGVPLPPKPTGADSSGEKSGEKGD
jgi:hypothetical protein